MKDNILDWIAVIILTVILLTGFVVLFYFNWKAAVVVLIVSLTGWSFIRLTDHIL